MGIRVTFMTTVFYTHTCTLPQDLFVDRLTEEVQRLEEQVALYKAQCTAQAQDSEAVKEALAEAAMELEVRGWEGQVLTPRSHVHHVTIQHCS